MSGRPEQTHKENSCSHKVDERRQWRNYVNKVLGVTKERQRASRC